MFRRFQWFVITVNLLLIGFRTASAQEDESGRVRQGTPQTHPTASTVQDFAPAPVSSSFEQSDFSTTETCCPAPSPPPAPWKTLFFENDFSDKNLCCAPYLFGEELKELSLDFPTHESRLSVGGELRFRHMNEDNRLRPGGPGKSTYDLWRWRNYIDFQYNESLRGYVEVIDASIFNEELSATSIDLNRWDIQNAFVDVRMTELTSGPVWVRFGRQELLYGSQRLVSPLD